MKFSKEEIETAKKVFETYKINPGCSNSYNEFLDSLLKPETKFINVRIEYVSDNFPLTADRVKSALELKYDITFRNFKVTELPEVFTAEDMNQFQISDLSLNDWISKGGSK